MNAKAVSDFWHQRKGLWILLRESSYGEGHSRTPKRVGLIYFNKIESGRKGEAPKTIAFCLPFARCCLFKRFYQEMRALVTQTEHRESRGGGGGDIRANRGQRQEGSRKPRERRGRAWGEGEGQTNSFFSYVKILQLCRTGNLLMENPGRSFWTSRSVDTSLFSASHVMHDWGGKVYFS